jgi:hypothetical protein
MNRKNGNNGNNRENNSFAEIAESSDSDSSTTNPSPTFVPRTEILDVKTLSTEDLIKKLTEINEKDPTNKEIDGIISNYDCLLGLKNGNFKSQLILTAQETLRTALNDYLESEREKELEAKRLIDEAEAKAALVVVQELEALEKSQLALKIAQDTSRVIMDRAREIQPQLTEGSEMAIGLSEAIEFYDYVVTSKTLQSHAAEALAKINALVNKHESEIWPTSVLEPSISKIERSDIDTDPTPVTSKTAISTFP